MEAEKLLDLNQHGRFWSQQNGSPYDPIQSSPRCIHPACVLSLVACHRERRAVGYSRKYGQGGCIAIAKTQYPTIADSRTIGNRERSGYRRTWGKRVSLAHTPHIGLPSSHFTRWVSVSCTRPANLRMCNLPFLVCQDPMKLAPRKQRYRSKKTYPTSPESGNRSAKSEWCIMSTLFIRTSIQSLTSEATGLVAAPGRWWFQARCDDQSTRRRGGRLWGRWQAGALSAFWSILHVEVLASPRW